MLRAVAAAAVLLAVNGPAVIAAAQEPSTEPSDDDIINAPARPKPDEFLPPPPARQEPKKALSWYKKFQATLAVGASAYSWGKIDPGAAYKAKVRQTFGAMFHLAFHYPVMEAVQVGGFAFFAPGLYKLVGEDKVALHDGGVGTSIRVGGRAGERIWLGGALELGFGFMTFDANTIEYQGNGFGLLLFPRFIVDILATRVLAVHLSAGLCVFPILKGHGEFLDLQDRQGIDARKLDSYSVRPVLMIGLTFGK